MSLATSEFLRINCTAAIVATQCKRCGEIVGYSSQLRLLVILESAHQCGGEMHPPMPVRLPKHLIAKLG